MPVEVPNEKKSVPDGLWRKCDGCHEIIYNKELENNLMVCPKCNHYFKVNAWRRIVFLCNENSFKEIDALVRPVDTLGFKDTKTYASRLKQYQKKSGLYDAIVTGFGEIGTHGVMLAVMDFDFMGGSMGSVVGEKISRAIEKAVAEKLPVIIVSSSGGARMQEGILSLMQMAKTSAALSRLEGEKLPFISVLVNPTTGGVSASFAMLGDVIIAEPGALIGFAGQRVIEQTIRQKLPQHFQRSEFLLEHGIIDMIVERKNLKSTIESILTILKNKK